MAVSETHSTEGATLVGRRSAAGAAASRRSLKKSFSPVLGGGKERAPRVLDAGTERNATVQHEHTILYADERKACSPRGGAGERSRNDECAFERESRGRRECTLRYATAGFRVVAANTDSFHCRGGVQRDSFAGADAALRSAGLAASEGRVRGREAMHLGLLASRDYSHCVVASKSWHGSDEYHGIRRAMDAQSDRVAGVWHGAGKFVAGRVARTSGDGAAARGRCG